MPLKIAEFFKGRIAEIMIERGSLKDPFGSASVREHEDAKLGYYVEYGIGKDIRERSFATYEEANNFRREMNLNVALYSMECKEDEAFRDDTPQFKDLFADRKVIEDEVGNISFGVGKRELPWRTPEECVKIIHRRLDDRGKRQGGFDLTEKLWSSDIAILVSNELMNQYKPQLTDEQLFAVGRYVGSPLSVNGFLQNLIKTEDEQIQQVVEDVFLMHDSMKPIDRDLYLHRSGKDRDKLGGDNSNSLLPQFISTAKDKQFTEEFYKGDGQDAQFYMKIPAGTPLLVVSQIRDKRSHINGYQNEVLLPPMQFEEVSLKKDGKVREFECGAPVLLDIRQIVLSRLDEMEQTENVAKARQIVEQRVLATIQDDNEFMSSP
jgi:hypothetical protein